jgi:hypothetical protein
MKIFLASEKGQPYPFHQQPNSLPSLLKLLTMPRKTSFFLCFATLLSFCAITLALRVVEPTWIDDKIKRPFGFRAFYTNSTETDNCSVEINFERDFNDQRYQYDVFAVYENGQKYYLKPNDTVNTDTSLAAVEATPKGQRGAYLLETEYTLTPIIVDICNIGANDTNFPPALKGEIPKRFSVQAVPAGVAHADKTVWNSTPFGFPLKNNTTPPSVTDVKALKTIKDQLSNENKINVHWKTTLDPQDVRGYFILAGRSEDASKVRSVLIEDPQATQGQIILGYHTDGYDVAVVTWAKNGALTSPAVATQVNVEDPS